jgi:hypothetical protein
MNIRTAVTRTAAEREKTEALLRDAILGMRLPVTSQQARALRLMAVILQSPRVRARAANFEREITMPSLYEISDRFRSIFQQLEETEGEITPEIDAQLEAAEASLEEKAEAYCAFIRELEAEAEKFRNEEVRLATTRKSLANKAQGLKDRLLSAMKFVRVKKVKAGPFSPTIQKSSSKVVVEDLDLIPEEHKFANISRAPLSILTPQLRQLAEIEVDKKRIAAALKEHPDTPIPGAHIEQGEYLRIY